MYIKAILIFLTLATIATEAKAEWVRGHYRSNGTYVRSYWRGPRSATSRPIIFIAKPPPSETEIRHARLKRQKALWEHRREMQADYKAKSLERSKAERHNRELREANRDPVHTAKMIRRSHIKAAEGLRVYLSKDLKYRIEASVVATDGESIVLLRRADGVEITVEFEDLRATDRIFLSNLGEYDANYDVF